jgi:hypothetical protein
VESKTSRKYVYQVTRVYDRRGQRLEPGAEGNPVFSKGKTGFDAKDQEALVQALLSNLPLLFMLLQEQLHAASKKHAELLQELCDKEYNPKHLRRGHPMYVHVIHAPCTVENKNGLPTASLPDFTRSLATFCHDTLYTYIEPTYFYQTGSSLLKQQFEEPMPAPAAAGPAPALDSPVPPAIEVAAVMNFLSSVQAGIGDYREMFCSREWRLSEEHKSLHVPVDKFWASLSAPLQLYILAGGSILENEELERACAAVLSDQPLNLAPPSEHASGVPNTTTSPTGVTGLPMMLIRCA